MHMNQGASMSNSLIVLQAGIISINVNNVEQRQANLVYVINYYGASKMIFNLSRA